MFFIPLISLILGAAFLCAAFTVPSNSGNTAVGLFFLVIALVSFLVIRRQSGKKQGQSNGAGASSGLSPWWIISGSWIVWILVFLRFIFHGFRISNFFVTLLLLSLVFIVLFLFTVHQLTEPSKRARQAAARRATSSSAPAAAPAADSGSVTFRVAGTTFVNDDGTSRQEILRHMKFGDEPWADDPEDLAVTIEEETFDGELALAVYVNDYQVGYVPKNLIQKVKRARQNVASCYVSDVKITGGGIAEDGRELSYGCTVTLEY